MKNNEIVKTALKCLSIYEKHDGRAADYFRVNILLPLIEKYGDNKRTLSAKVMYIAKRTSRLNGSAEEFLATMNIDEPEDNFTLPPASPYTDQQTRQALAEADYYSTCFELADWDKPPVQTGNMRKGRPRRIKHD